MPIPHQQIRSDLKSARWHLGKSLLRLHQRLDQAQEKDSLHNENIATLQKELSGLGEQISERLKSLEIELGQILGETSSSALWNVVGSPGEKDRPSHTLRSRLPVREC